MVLYLEILIALSLIYGIGFIGVNALVRYLHTRRVKTRHRDFRYEQFLRDMAEQDEYERMNRAAR